MALIADLDQARAERIARAVLALVDLQGCASFAEIMARVPGARGSVRLVMSRNVLLWPRASQGLADAVELLRPVLEAEPCSSSLYAEHGMTVVGAPIAEPDSEVPECGAFPVQTWVPVLLRRRTEAELEAWTAGGERRARGVN